MWGVLCNTMANLILYPNPKYHVPMLVVSMDDIKSEMPIASSAKSVRELNIHCYSWVLSLRDLTRAESTVERSDS